MPALVFAPPFASATALRAEEDALVLRLVAVLLLLGCCGSLFGDKLCRHRYQKVAVIAPDEPEGFYNGDVATRRGVRGKAVAAAALSSSGGAPDEKALAARGRCSGAEFDESDSYEL